MDDLRFELDHPLDRNQPYPARRAQGVTGIGAGTVAAVLDSGSERRRRAAGLAVRFSRPGHLASGILRVVLPPAGWSQRGCVAAKGMSAARDMLRPRRSGGTGHWGHCCPASPSGEAIGECVG